MVVDVPMANGESQQQIGTAIKLSGHDPAYQFTGAKLGSHSKDILLSLGYSPEEVKAFYKNGVTAG